MNENAIGKEVVDAAVQVHRELGPGMLETVYEVVFARELERRGLAVERQVPVADLLWWTAVRRGLSGRHRC
jgi:GxxExxY protein